ncbi:MAG: orotate phosphoribosyltransferase [Candidatus Thermoplasmatota archaeon]
MVDLFGLCSMCGKPDAMYTCHLCGQLVCSRCFSFEHGICRKCAFRAQK